MYLRIDHHLFIIKSRLVFYTKSAAMLVRKQQNILFYEKKKTSLKFTNLFETSVAVVPCITKHQLHWHLQKAKCQIHLWIRVLT